MKKYTLLIICFNLLFAFGTLAKSTIIPVDSIFKNITQIREVKVLFYTGDTTVSLLDIVQGDTIELDCRDEKLRYDSLLASFGFKQHDTFKYEDKRQATNNDYTEFDNGGISYKAWDGTYPRNDEVITMINFHYYGERILFGRKKDDHIRFWSPRVNSLFDIVYVIEKGELYVPLDLCKLRSADVDPENQDLEFRCSDGFIISQIDFDKIRKQH